MKPKTHVDPEELHKTLQTLGDTAAKVTDILQEFARTIDVRATTPPHYISQPRLHRRR